MFIQAFFIAFSLFMSACQSQSEPRICVSGPDGIENMMSSSEYRAMQEQKNMLYGKWQLSSFRLTAITTMEDKDPITDSTSMKVLLDKAPRGNGFYIAFDKDGHFHYNMDKNSCSSGNFEAFNNGDIHIQLGGCTEMCCDQYDFLYDQASAFHIFNGVLELRCGDITYQFERAK